MPAWILALLSCAHVACAAYRQHRSAPGARRITLTAVSYVLAVTPWFTSGLTAAIATIVAHAVWLVLTDRVAFSRTAAMSATRRATDGKPLGSPAAPRKPDQRAASAAHRASNATPKGFVAATVVAIIDEAPDIRTFRIARPAGFGFKPGQFLPVRVRIDATDHVRCYSISSAPHIEGYLEISVKRQGLISNALHATLRPGSSLCVRSPGGVFVYPSGDDRPLVLLAGGIGVTPLRSMALHAVAADPHRPVLLVQSAREESGLAFADEFRVLHQRHPHFRWMTAVSRGATNPAHYPGRIDREMLALAAPDIRDSIVCICGPTPMIDGVCVALADLGVPETQIRFERFEAAVASVGAQNADAAVPAQSGDTAPVITFARTGKTCEGAGQATLLDLAEQSGIEIPSICRAGVCGTCRTRVIDGDVHCASTTLDPDDTAEGFVLACIAHPLSDCTVEA